MPLAHLAATTWRDLELGIRIEHAHTPVDDAAIDAAEAEFLSAFAAMRAIEAGEIANPDEQRQVGHYWLRAPHLAPPELAAPIEAAIEAARRIATEIHKEGRYTTALIIGIGGSALGAQFVSAALAEPHDPIRLCFLDNTDPDGISAVLGPLDLDTTLVVVISKSGSTAETRNGLLETQAAFERSGAEFAPQAIAITGVGSALWELAAGWRSRLPMWDWVGGRTSVTSAVGLFPLLLQGCDVDELLAGAAAMDERTRVPSVRLNPSARLALLWHTLGAGQGKRAMVLLPYRDRLVLLSRYLQQLVMESLGKERNLLGEIVHHGLSVYGNKGSTDQHAYVQQLRDGPDDHFVTFVAVDDDGYHGGIDVEPGLDCGDYLQGFLLGTRRALAERHHPSLTVTLSEVDAFHVGALIALYERAVGLYGARVGINAYNQPGVEAGKRAANGVLVLKAPLLAALTDTDETCTAIATRAGVTDTESAWFLLTRLAANQRGVASTPGATPAADLFRRRAD